MQTPKYLRKKDTGELFIYTHILAQREDMEAMEEGAESTSAEAASEKPIDPDFDTLSKKELIEYIFSEFGARIDGRIAEADVREEAANIAKTAKRIGK